MKKLFLLLLLPLCFVSLNICGDEPMFFTASDTAMMMKSKYFSFERKVFINIPARYTENDSQNYDVIYVFDTQDKPYFDIVNGLLPFINTNYDSRFIVVGLCSPTTMTYSRQSDFLPVPKTVARGDFYGGRNGYADSLCLFVKNELIPYINSHYRTTGRTLAVGHSLGASFILEAMINHELFTDYIAVSPNLAYDSDRVSDELMAYNYSQIKGNRFLFITNSTEEKVPRWKSWKPAREKLYKFYKENILPSNIMLKIKSYPDYNHMSCFPYALHDGLEYYFHYRDSIDNFLSRENYKVHIELKTLRADDEVYITGNQFTLGDWNPSKVKMKRISDYVRDIDVDLYYPALFKFTRGSWNSVGFVENTGVYGNLRIESPDRHSYKFIIENWRDIPER